ncbi:MAG: flagellar hook-length control protein FliK [Synergistaceae bacterium]|nr:flagellar hook-length control protein FliK [Synergistaceae bacterium]
MADLLAIDIQAQAPKQTAATISNSNDKTENKSGFFDSLMNEYGTKENLHTANNKNTAVSTGFKGINLFSGSVIDVLANMDAPELLNNFAEADGAENLFAQLKNSLTKIKNSQSEVFYTEEEINFNENISQLLNMTEEELNSKISSLPEEAQQEIKNLIDEIINSVKKGGDVTQPLEKLAHALSGNEIKLEPENKNKIIKNDDDDDSEIKSDEGQELDSEIINAAGLAGVQSEKNNNSENVEAKPEKNLSLKNNEPHSKQVQYTVNNNDAPKIESKAENENAGPDADFNKILEKRENPEENNFSDTGENNESEDQNFNQARENFSDSRNQSRSRNDARRTSNEISRADDDRGTGSNAHRTERSDFQNFFEGVLNSRRTSQTSTQPLNLRENLNFNQSETLRSGLVNVVRFIRADGVQKANVIVDPPALGRISVELTSSSSGVEASIKVASEQIRQLVQDQLSQLRMNLAEQGVQVAEFTVDVQQDSQQNGRNSQDENNNQNGRAGIVAGAEEDDTEEFRVDLEEGLLYWVA